MSSINSISAEKLARLVGTPNAPILIDVRDDAGVAALPGIIPASARRNYREAGEWAGEFGDNSVVVICHHGLKLSQGVAAVLRASGTKAETLDGGIAAWQQAELPLIPIDKLPPTGLDGRTRWVTRERPKIDRIACPWLIRRFVDPKAVFLFVPPADVPGVAQTFGAVPFDIEDVFWSHRGELCTFDVMLEEFDLGTAPLKHLATLVRAADTARLDLAPEAAGLLAASLGLSRMHAEDLAQLEAGLGLFDAFYRWCRDATGETHNWPVNKPGA